MESGENEFQKRDGKPKKGAENPTGTIGLESYRTGYLKTDG